MVLPSTWLSALLLLVLSFFCLGTWANTFKAAGNRWRFELFSFDFAIGALLFAVLTAFTLGTLGSDLGFGDRMLVAGRTTQAFGVAAGAAFALGNMLLLAAVSLLGLSAAFPLCIGIAVVVASLIGFRDTQLFLLAAGVILVLAAVIFASVAARSGKTAQGAKPTAPAKPGVRPPGRKKMANVTKGIIASIISGISLGAFFPIIHRGFRGDFGLGPYAGLLLLTIALLASTVVLNLYFMNISIAGEPIGFSAYFTGLPRQHFLGFGGGALWALGMLAQGLAMSAPAGAGFETALKTILPLASVALAVFWGLTKWKEFATAPQKTRTSLLLAALLFLGGIVLVGFAQ